MSGIIWVLSKQTDTWKGTPLLADCFPGLGSKASWLLNNNVFFPCYFIYLFFRTRGPFIPLDPPRKHACVLSEQRFKLWRIFCFDIPQWQWASEEDKGTLYAPPPIPSSSIPAPSSSSPLLSSSLSFLFFTNNRNMFLVLMCLSAFLLGILDHHQPSLCGEGWVFLQDIHSLREGLSHSDLLRFFSDFFFFFFICCLKMCCFYF